MLPIPIKAPFNFNFIINLKLLKANQQDMHSFCLMAMVGAVASARDLFAKDRRELVAGTEYEGFQNFVGVADGVELCEKETAEGELCAEDDILGVFSVGSSWYEQGSTDKTLYYGLIAEFAFNREAYEA